MKELARRLAEKLRKGGRLWLFLDYDGTLAEFAPNPDVVLPDPDLIALIGRLVRFTDQLRVVILSGRRLGHIARLLPVPGTLLAGTYGIEFQDWEGKRVQLLDFESERPFLDQVKTAWAALIAGGDDFYLEDKGYSLALHGRRAEEQKARRVIAEAAQAASRAVEKGTFRMMGGNKFLEVAPVIADKGQSVSALLKRFPWPGADIIYIGDDDKDEDAFKVVEALGGISILVAKEPRQTVAQYRLENPGKVRRWLAVLADELSRPD